MPPATRPGLALGELISISAASTAPGPFYGPFYGEDGTFGPGKYCGKVRRAITKRDASGKRKVVGSRTTRQCRIPQFVVANPTMVFSTA